MLAQWRAHNAGYKIASSGKFGFWLVQQLGGSSNPIACADVLDIRSINNIADTQRLIYNIISWFE